MTFHTKEATREAWLRTAAVKLGIELTPRFIIAAGKPTTIKATDAGEREFGMTTVSISTRDGLHVARFENWWALTPAISYPLFTLTAWVGDTFHFNRLGSDTLWGPRLLAYNWPKQWPGDVASILRQLE